MAEILGKDKIIGMLHDALGFATADETEISFGGSETSLTRFANNYVHQNVKETNTMLKVRSVIGQKVGTATGNSLDNDSLKALVAKAEQMARFQVEDPHFKGLPGADYVSRTDLIEPDEATYNADPELRAKAVGIICTKSHEKGLNASGAFKTEGYERVVVNSRGLSNYFRGASSDIVTVIMGESSSGYATALSPRVSEIDGEAIAEEALEKTVRSLNPITVEPGEYEVILEEYATAIMLFYMGYLGMGALSLQEGRSFMQLGRQITHSNVNIYDDGYDTQGIFSPFDTEGVTRQKVELIKNGVANAVVYDTYSAAKEPGKRSTGHSIGFQGDLGAVPLNLVMAAGDSSKAEMLKNTKRGIWVTRFHYVNPLVPDKAVLTGMTRDGTFLIENGEIVAPLKNFRFTHSAVEALNEIESISQERKLVNGDFFGAVLAPAIKVKRFTFNSGTEF
jgi:predicted Zn-dependent protease